eukprot:5492567-Heterocapsa_arctica.AAC.1
MRSSRPARGPTGRTGYPRLGDTPTEEQRVDTKWPPAEATLSVHRVNYHPAPKSEVGVRTTSVKGSRPTMGKTQGSSARSDLALVPACPSSLKGPQA